MSLSAFGYWLMLASAAPTPAAAPPPETLKVLVLDLRAEGVAEQTARIVRDEITMGMSKSARLEVLSSEDVRQVISVDAEKKALGCDTSSCLAEVGAALGARYIVHGSISQLGELTIVHLNLFDTDASRALARESAEARAADALLPSVRLAVARMRGTMLGETVVDETKTRGASVLTYLGAGTAGVGAAVAAAGVVMMVLAWPAYSDGNNTNIQGRQQAQQSGQFGTLLLAGGAVVSVVGGGVLALGLWE